MLCILAGLTELPFRRFALLVVIARPWGLLFASALGGAALSFPLWAMALMGAGGAVLFVLGMKYGEQIRDRVVEWVRGRRKS